MPALRRRRDPEPPPGTASTVPWALGTLLRDGPAPLGARPPSGDRLAVALVLGPADATPRDAGLPPGLLDALEPEGVDLRVLTADDAEDGGPLSEADVVLAAGWPAAPAVLTARGVRARAVLATAEPPPLAELGWARDIAVLGPPWLGGDLPGGVDQAYVPMPVHRREDLVLVHGEEPFGLLAAAELARRRDDLAFAVSGVRPDLELPFAFLGVEPGATALTHAFASATVALAPPVRGWRPAALAMLACGQTVVAPGDAAGRAALPAGTAVLADGPLAAADATERLLADLADRADRTRAGLAHVTAGWAATATALTAALRALG
jgi:hypothetical protein